MLHKAIGFVVLSSFISFAGYAVEQDNAEAQEEVQVQWTVAKEVQLAKCNCGKGGKGKNQDDDSIIEEDEVALAACGKCQPPKHRDNDAAVDVEEEEEVEEETIA
jgi:hypothetical protein